MRRRDRRPQMDQVGQATGDDPNNACSLRPRRLSPRGCSPSVSPPSALRTAYTRLAPLQAWKTEKACGLPAASSRAGLRARTPGIRIVAESRTRRTAGRRGRTAKPWRGTRQRAGGRGPLGVRAPAAHSGAPREPHELRGLSDGPGRIRTSDRRIMSPRVQLRRPPRSATAPRMTSTWRPSSKPTAHELA
jgi:hypothetical protein